MFVTKRRINCFISPEQKQLLSTLNDTPWKQFYVQGGEIQKSQLVLPPIYSVGNLIILPLNGQAVSVSIESTDVGGDEVFHLFVRDGTQQLETPDSYTNPPLAPLEQFPRDLDVRRFLDTSNELSLLRFRRAFQEDNVARSLSIDSGLLVSNTLGRLILYPNFALPLDFCVSTSSETIDRVLDPWVDIVKLS